MPHEMKSLLTILNRPEDMAAILEWASRLAKDLDASSDGVIMKYDLTADPTAFVDGFGYFGSDAILRDLAEASARAERAARKEFDEAVKRAPRGRLDRLQVISNGRRGELASLARCYDLAIAHLPEGPTLVADETLLGELLLQGGAPVFAAPRAAQSNAPLQRALVAWDGSLEAARALRAALPFIKECRAVHLRAVAEKGDRHVAMDRIARYLELHGVVSDSAVMEAADGGAGQALLDAAESLGADFIVMGAFGRSPWREQLFGGATHTVVRASKKPVILGH